MGNYFVGVDLGQAQDYTAIAIVEKVRSDTAGPRREDAYHLLHLERPALGTRYPAIVQHVIGLLDRAPLTRHAPLCVDKTGVGSAVVDMFTAAGVRPHAITITGGDAVNKENAYDLRVPKRELVSTLVALYQGHRIKTAEGLTLAPALLNELVNFKIKVNLTSGHDSYEAWRESTHDDLVLAVVLACWYAEHGPQAPFGWLRNDPAVVAAVKQAQARHAQETDEQRIARRMAARGLAVPGTPAAPATEEQPHKYGAPLPNPYLPERHE